MRKIVFLFLISLSCQRCLTYDLDDVEYDKMPPLFTLDDYHRCLLYNGTYCVVRADLYADPSNDLMNQIINYTKSSHIKHYNHTYLEKGVCVSKTCGDFIGNRSLDSTDDLQSILEECINYNIAKEYGLQARATVYYCNKSTDQKPKEILDWAVLAVLISIVILNISATLYDCMLSEETSKTLSRGQRMFLCFSMIRNWNHLISNSKVHPSLARMEGLHSVRVASSFAMIVGHVIWIYMMGFIDNPHDFERAFEIPHYQLLFNGMNIVQVFFVISGFFLIYNLEIAGDSHKITLKTIPAIYIRRFLRLAPPLAVMLSFTATWLRFMGSGPLWDRHVTPVVNDCRRWWWTHLLFINNYVVENKFCAIQTWHIAADTQLFFVGLVIFIMTRRRHRNLVIGLLLALSLIPPALHVYFQDLDAEMLKHPEFLRSLDNKNFETAYVFGHNNITCFVMGMFIAYKLHEWHKTGFILKGPVYTFLYRITVLCHILFVFAGNFFYEEDYRTPLWARMLFQSLHRPITGLWISFFIIGLDMGLDTEYMDRLYNWKGFAILGRLTYSVYLLHMNFIPIIAGSKTQLAHLSYLDMVVSKLGIIALSFMVSVPFYLMVEAPINPLVKILLLPKKALKSLDTQDLTDSGKSFLETVAKKKNRATENGKESLKTDENANILNGDVIKNEDKKVL